LSEALRHCGSTRRSGREFWEAQPQVDRERDGLVWCLSWFERWDVKVRSLETALHGAEKAADRVEYRAFACTVWTDQRGDLVEGNGGCSAAEAPKVLQANALDLHTRALFHALL
jgi:hypothetical protein